MITQSLVEHAAVPELERTQASSFNDEQQRARSMLPWGFMLMFVGVAIAVIGKMLVHEEVITVVGVLVTLAGMFLTVYPSLSPAPRRKFDTSPPAPPKIPTHSQRGQYLPQERDLDFVPSITERTTQLLKSSGGTRSRP